FCCTPVGRLASREFPGWSIVELGERNLLQTPKIRKQLRSCGPFELLIDLRALRALSDTLASSWIPAHSKIGIVSDRSDKSSAFWGESTVFDDLLVCNSDSVPIGLSVEIWNYMQLARVLFPGAVSESLVPNLTATMTG